MRKFVVILLLLQFCFHGAAALAFDLPPPPARGSVEEIKDYQVLHLFQAERTSEECRVAETQSSYTSESFFGPETGILTAAEFQSVKIEVDQLMRKAADVSRPFKTRYARIRPYNNDKTLHPCVDIPNGNFSYPSGHSAAGYLVSQFLVKKFPGKSEAILKQGIQIGLNRVIGGVHHPSDVDAGRSLGQQIADEMFGLE